MGRVVNIAQDGVVIATLPENVDSAVATIFIQELKQAIQSRSTKARIITDVSKVQGMPPVDAKEIIVEGIKNNRPYIQKSAVCGFGNFGVIAARLIITLAGRSDIKVFKTQKEAHDWVST